MNQQLQEIADELAHATARLHQLRESVAADRWTTRNAPDRWSVAECVEHLNLTSAAFVPPLTAGIETARKLQVTPHRYRRGFLGWALWKMTGPDARGRMQTPPSFVPTRTVSAEEIVADFERWQATLHTLLSASDGLPIDKVMMTSPFNARIRYNLFAGFSAIPRHQHRHLQQAERVWGSA